MSESSEKQRWNLDGVISSIRVASGRSTKNERVERQKKEAASTFDDAEKKQPTDFIDVKVKALETIYRADVKADALDPTSA